jgi:hypothetical protein
VTGVLSVIIVMLMVLTTTEYGFYLRTLEIFSGKNDRLTLIGRKKMMAWWRLAVKEILQLVV